MVVRAAYRLASLGLAFARDRRGSNTVEFVISIPILLAVLVLSTEYGKILHQRTVLDSAVADATRYLSRVPYDPAFLPTQKRFPTGAVDYANEIIGARVSADNLQIDPPEIRPVGGFDSVYMRATAVVSSPALSVLNIARPNTTVVNGRDVSNGITIESAEQFRHFGQ